MVDADSCVIETREKLAVVLNESELPVTVLRYIVKDLYGQLADAEAALLRKKGEQNGQQS